MWEEIGIAIALLSSVLFVFALMKMSAFHKSLAETASYRSKDFSWTNAAIMHLRLYQNMLS
jgi:hypothetical protein